MDQTEKAKCSAKKAWVAVDIGNSAFATTVLAAVFPAFLPSLLPKEGLRVNLGFFEWTTSAISIWGYAVSFSLTVTLLIALFLGSWADEKGYRKTFLIFFSALGAAATISLAFCETWTANLLFFILANIGFAAGNVFYNSLLPIVADEKDWDGLSLKAFAWGYVGGGLVLALNLLFIMKPEWFFLSSRTEGIKLSFAFVGIWWLSFCAPAFFLIHEEKNPRPLGGSFVIERLSQLFLFFRQLRFQIPILIFIIAYAFFNDGIQTVISMAAIYGKEILQLEDTSIIGTLLLIQFLGWPFTLMMIKLSKHFGAKRLLSIALCFWLGIVVYAYQMSSSLDFLVLGILVAIVLGVSQALARSIYSRLIPRKRSAEYFSLYALSGKFSSILGPLMFALVKDFSGSARLAILSLAAFFLIGVILLQFVSIDHKNKAALE